MGLVAERPRAPPGAIVLAVHARGRAHEEDSLGAVIVRTRELARRVAGAVVQPITWDG